MIQPMYPPQNNSPRTTLASNINSAATTMTVADGSILPSAPCVLTIGADDNAELVLCSNITGNIVTMTRGYFGTTAAAWDADTYVYRAINAQDISALQENVNNAVSYSPQPGRTDAEKQQACENIGVPPSLQSNVAYYVSTTGNDDTGDGSADAPFATINKALSILPKCLGGFSAAINITQGTYIGGVNIVGFYAGTLTLYAVGGLYSTIAGYLDIISCTAAIVCNAIQAINYRSGTGLTGSALLYIKNCTSVQFFGSSAHPGLSLNGSGSSNAYAAQIYEGTVSFYGQTPGLSIYSIAYGLYIGGGTHASIGGQLTIASTVSVGLYMSGGFLTAISSKYSNAATTKITYISGVFAKGSTLNPTA